MIVNIKKLSEDAIIPTKATSGSIGYDLYVPKDIIIKKGRQVIPLDFAIELPINFKADIQGRSGYESKGFEGYTFDGLQTRFDCDVLTGLVDEDFRGNVGVIINNRDSEFMVHRGQRVAQMVIQKVERTSLNEVNFLSQTKRGEGGFGSTDKNK